MIGILKIAAAPVISLFTGKGKGALSLKVLGIAALVAFLGFKFWQLEGAREDLAQTRQTLQVEQQARARAETEVQEAVERAERISAAKDAAQARLTDRMSAIAEAQGECLETELPAGLLD